MAELWKAVLEEFRRKKWYVWLGYTAWIVVLLLNLSFILGSWAENEPQAALVGIIVFFVILAGGISVRLFYKLRVKKQQNPRVRRR